MVGSGTGVATIATRTTTATIKRAILKNALTRRAIGGGSSSCGLNGCECECSFIGVRSAICAAAVRAAAATGLLRRRGVKSEGVIGRAGPAWPAGSPAVLSYSKERKGKDLWAKRWERGGGREGRRVGREPAEVAGWYREMLIGKRPFRRGG
eukprot:scaffold178334_cov31-Tisochrysis_lutea.AAC.1